MRKFVKITTCREMLSIFAVVLSFAISGEAAAVCGVLKPYVGSTGVVFNGNQSIQTTSSTPLGTVIWHSTPVAVGSTVVDCTNHGGAGINQDLLLYDRASGNDVPKGNSIVALGVTGLSYRFRTGNSAVGPYVISGGDFIAQQVAGRTLDFQTLTLEIIKTGPIMDGSGMPSGIFASYYINGATVYNFTLSGKLSITSLTCKAQNVTVPMGTRKTSEFKGLGTRLSPVNFAIQLNACPAGINSVKYRLDPTTTITNPVASVVELSADSTATGVGVQILDNTGNPFPLGTDTVFSNYDVSGGNFSIPLKTAYYQTANSIKSGIANTSLTFTMTYQ